MIEFILGKTGSGKSYLALRRVADFLVESDDGYVVTNLAINLGALNAYLKKEYPDREPDVCGRVRLLSEQEARQFYLHREVGNDIEAVSKEDEKALKFPAFEAAANRSQLVLYVIDEAHIFFDAREWANVGATLNFFASQHRKFRSDVIFITQFLDQVEKRLRQHSTKFTECVNYGMRKFTLWKLPSVFRTLETYKAPPCPVESSGTRRMNKELADCYDTTAGVGVSGGRKPEKIRRKGLPFWTLLAGAAALVVVFWFAPDLFVKGITKAVSADVKIAPAPMPAPARADQKQASNVKIEAPVATYTAPSVGPGREMVFQPSPKMQVRGWAVRGNGKAVVQMADGRRITEQDAEFGGIARRGNAVVIEGQKLFLVEPRAGDQNAVKVKETAQDAVEPKAPTVGNYQYQGEAVIPTPESAARIANMGPLFPPKHEMGASAGPAQRGPTASSPSLVRRGDNRDRTATPLPR